MTFKNKQKFALFEKSTLRNTKENNNFKGDLGTDVDDEINEDIVVRSNNNVSGILLPESNKKFFLSILIWNLLKRQNWLQDFKKGEFHLLNGQLTNL